MTEKVTMSKFQIKALNNYQAVLAAVSINVLTSVLCQLARCYGVLVLCSHAGINNLLRVLCTSVERQVSQGQLLTHIQNVNKQVTREVVQR